jgi:hypothetical protein
LANLECLKRPSKVGLSLKYSEKIQNGNNRIFKAQSHEKLDLRLIFSCLDKTLIGRARWEDLPASQRSALCACLQQAGLELWQILTFWFFWVKPKERKKE